MKLDRAKLYQLLAVGRNAVGMDEDAYREMLAQYGAKEKAGKVSAKTMTLPQLEKALEHLKRCGFAVVRSDKRKGHPGVAGVDRNELISKVEAQLADMALSWAYGDGIAKRMFGIERVRFCDAVQLKAIIAALYNRKKKLVKEEQ